MRAAVFHAVGEPLTVEEVSEPRATASDLVLEVKSCGICGSDLHVAGVPGALPDGTIMGHEFAGEVVEVGPEAGDRWRAGDRVVSMPFFGCGRCRACLSGDAIWCSDIKTMGLGAEAGAFAEYVRVGDNESLRLPDSVSWREGALVEPLSVGLHAVNEAALSSGANVLIIGAGPVGLSTVLWARFLGARSVVVAEKVEGRLALAEKFGATAVIDASKDAVATAFQEEVGAPPDAIFECVGLPGLIQQCIDVAPVRGRVVVAGVCVRSDTFVPVTAILKEICFKFVLGYRKQDFQFTVDMLDAERIRAEAMVTDSVDLDGLPAAFEALKQPTHQCKVVLEP